MAENWKSDRQYQEHELAEVSVSSEQWGPKTSDGWCLTTPAIADAPWVPKAGDSARYFGRGIGSCVRGVVFFRPGCQPLVAHYRSEAEHEADNAREAQQRDAEKQAELDASVAERDARWAALPDEFQARHRRFMAGAADYRRDYEEYELFCCEQAWAIVQGGVTDMTAFRVLDFEQQRAAVPAISDGHSGNTFGVALRLAHWWLTKRENVTAEHGAMVPLVGCKDYGCTHPQ